MGSNITSGGPYWPYLSPSSHISKSIFEKNDFKILLLQILVVVGLISYSPSQLRKARGSVTVSQIKIQMDDLGIGLSGDLPLVLLYQNSSIYFEHRFVKDIKFHIGNLDIGLSGDLSMLCFYINIQMDN